VGRRIWCASPPPGSVGMVRFNEPIGRANSCSFHLYSGRPARSIGSSLLPDQDNSGVAMALNGGLAYSGGICGALSGAALAIREERKRAHPNDHAGAKRAARETVRFLLDRFHREFGSTSLSDPDRRRSFCCRGTRPVHSFGNLAHAVYAPDRVHLHGTSFTRKRLKERGSRPKVPGEGSRR
jgi:hypothetical protein